MKNYTNEEILKRKNKKEFFIEKIKLIIVILISLIVIYNISLIVKSIKNPDKTPSVLGIKTFAIISGSMMPEINVGDIVIVKEIEEQDFDVGDIITFRKSTEMITHRISKVEQTPEGKKYITKGDNNHTEDADEVLYNSVEGKVVSKIPKLGKIVIALKNKLTVLMILIIFSIMYLFDIKNQNKKIMREKKKELLNQRRQ